MTINSQTEPITISTHTILHQHRDGYWLIADNPEGNVFGHIKCEINLAGKLILQAIDGNRNINEVVKELCDSNALDEIQSRPWVTAFVDNMIERGILRVGRHSNHIPLTVVGTGDDIYPSHVSIEVTNACNLRCSFCYLCAGPDKRDRLDYREITDLLDDFKEHGVVAVSLTGGEFFLHPYAIEILAYACNRFPSVGLLTNGTVFPQAAIDLLKQHRSQVTVSISIDSARPDLHNRMRGGRTAYERSTRTIRTLASNGILVRMSSVIVEDNMWQLDELAQLAISLGARAFSFNFVEGFGRGEAVKKQQSANFDPGYSKYVSTVIEKYRRLIPIFKGEELSNTRRNCGAGTSSVSIGADGTVRPCPLFPTSNKLKNVRDDSLSSILETPLHRALESIPAPSEANGCSRDCDHFYECHNCYLRGLNVNANRPANAYCSWIRKNELQALVGLVRREPEPITISRKRPHDAN
ncbi:radical SAM protein [Actinomyces sp.]|uniref:radical SAM/SPASM domain-containing protein n=1 Tax=Actinomyces sp. TaxID=29317 RepID=UPI0026DDBD29|nr:radical SAM protein [Actinomyces sp.]MDO4900655.1 radical SAM protein [Actinomyces sp.]